MSSLISPSAGSPSVSTGTGLNRVFGAITRRCSAPMIGWALLALAPATMAQNLGEAGRFALLALNGGSMDINSSSYLEGDVGYSNGVSSSTNQKAETFIGGAYVHSGASFSYAAQNFLPTDGINTGSLVDQRLDQANQDVLLLTASLDLMGSTQSLGFLADDDSRVVTSDRAVNVIDIAGMNFNSDSLTFRSRSGFNDVFIVRMAGNMDFSQSSIALQGLTASGLLWYFPEASSVMINKSASSFRGTILAPTGSVEYHNPASFEGAIIANSISVHSDFQLNHVEFIPEPSTAMLGIVASTLLLKRRRRDR